MSKNIFLVIETATKFGSISLFDDDVEINRLIGIETSRLSVDVIGMISELTSQSNMKLADISKIVVSNGPGNFTGLRIGFAVGKGLAKSLSVPFLSVPILDILLLDASNNVLKCAFISVGGGKIAYKLSNSNNLVNVSITQFKTDLLPRTGIEFITIKETLDLVFSQESSSEFENISTVSDCVSTLIGQHFTKIPAAESSIIYS